MRALLLASVVVVGAGIARPSFAAEATFTAAATTQAALTVSCTDNLRFGTVAVEPGNAPATITVAASGGSIAVSSALSAVYALGVSGPASCTVANETGGDATASLASASGTFSVKTLSGLKFVDAGAHTLDADV